MLIVYLACLIFGGIILGASFLFGGDHDTNIDTDHTLDFDHSGELPVDSGGIEIEHSPNDINVSLHNDHLSVSEAATFFSIRNMIFFITFFGLTGTVLSLMSVISMITLICSIGIGASAWLFGYKLMKYLKSSESGEGLSIYSLKGKSAKVIMPIGKNRKGKVQINTGSQSLQLIAKASDISETEEFKKGDEVLIIEVRENYVYVINSDFNT